MNIREQLRYASEVEKNEVDRLLAIKILSQEIDKPYFKIEELAKACFTTKSSVVRFCKKLGFDGYKEFFYQLKFEDKKYYDVKKGEQTNVTSSYFTNYQSQLIEWINSSNYLIKDLSLCNDMIRSSNDVYIFTSFELDHIPDFYVDFLLINSKNVKYITSRKNQSALISLIKKEDVQIYLVAGVDNNYLSNIINRTPHKDKKIILTSNSQSYKYNEYGIKIEIDYPKEVVNINNKIIYISYVLKQLMNMYSEKNVKNYQQVLL